VYSAIFLDISAKSFFPYIKHYLYFLSARSPRSKRTSGLSMVYLFIGPAQKIASGTDRTIVSRENPTRPN